MTKRRAQGLESTRDGGSRKRGPSPRVEDTKELQQRLKADQERREQAFAKALRELEEDLQVAAVAVPQAKRVGLAGLAIDAVIVVTAFEKIGRQPQEAGDRS